MIKRLQRLKAKRGFTMVELIVAIAVIGVMIGVLLAAADTKREKIAEANTTASDFYSTLQAEFTGFQMFDGPLTMTLNRAYRDGTIIGSNGKLGGMKYYPYVGGNYPFDGGKLAGETHENGTPKKSQLYIECYTFGSTIRRVNYASDLSTLIDMVGNSGNTDAQICLVLQQELRDRMHYRDGYYYARISYTPPDGIGLTRADYRNVSVKVDWVAYCSNEITSNAQTYTFKSQNILNSGTVCGVHTTTVNPTLGTTGTSLMDASVDA